MTHFWSFLVNYSFNNYILPTSLYDISPQFQVFSWRFHYGNSRWPIGGSVEKEMNLEPVPFSKWSFHNV